MFNLLWNKPKPERFSLENLKSLCEQLQHFPGDANEDRIVSCLKELTQLLIWGDQHDPLLLEHFFEQNVHWHFLKILQSEQDGSLIVQVLQTLNIMFENVRSRESLYFLLSNNYVNQVIGLRYDFSNDEILAYYIYLLRTLSFKLSKDTIYFFFNEHLDDFPLYSEAIKFFNHEESMIRIAVRVITLNVYSVNDRQMQDFILDRTTTTYFSNLVWFIGNYGTTVNDMLLHPGDGEFSRMNYYLAEHMDCFYYVNDIIELDVSKINKILISHLLNRLLRPMYLDCLLPAGAAGSSGTKSSLSSTPKLTPLVALSLMLHAFHVLKHAPLVSALTSTLFSNQHYSSQPPHHNHNHHHNLLRPSPLMLGNLSVSPESSRPASPVTSKFHSFGLLGTSPAASEQSLPPLSSSTPNVPLSPKQPATGSPHTPTQSSNGTQQQQQQNPYKTSIYEYLSHVDNDRLVLPVLILIYLAGHNPGVMSDVLLGTDIYPQRLLKSRLLMGNLVSSASHNKTAAMSRERSTDSILSTQSAGPTANTAWNPAPSGHGGSLFGPAGSAAAARMKTRTESPLFEAEEDNEESRETEELLASEDSRPAAPPHPPISISTRTPSRTPMGSLSSSLTSPKPGSSSSFKDRVVDGDAFGKRTQRSGKRRGSKASSLLGPILSAPVEAPQKNDSGAEAIEQELKPIRISKEDREVANIYPSTDEEDVGDFKKDNNQGADKPPPLPPRPSLEQQDIETSVQRSVRTQTGPTIFNREDLMDRLMDIICGQPESGAHRFRIITIQMATELLIELVYTKGGVGKEGQASHVAQAAAESQLGEARLHRLALAETLFRDRVHKGIRALEKRKRSAANVSHSNSGTESTHQPLGMSTGRVERAMTESKLGIDRHIVNVISESTIIYGPDKNLENEPDLDPDLDLISLFNLDPKYTSMDHDNKDDGVYKQDQPPLSSSSNESTQKDTMGVKFMDKFKTRGQAASLANVPTMDKTPTPASPRPAQRTPSSVQRLEAMVIRYIKWLHTLIQCRQLVCRKVAAMTGSPLAPTVATNSVDANIGAASIKSRSPAISITETSTTAPALSARRPSDLLLGTSSSSSSNSGAVASAHKGLQKALATTATTTATTRGADLPENLGSNPLPSSSLASSPSINGHSVLSSTSPSAASSISSLSSMAASPAVSAMLSQPATGTASGRIIGSRTLLTATAALEAAAATGAAETANYLTNGSGPSALGGVHPFVNDMLSNHLDPLSATVSEAIRKSSARIKKSMVDPLSTNTMFKSGLTMSLTSPGSSGQNSTAMSGKRGFYRPLDDTSAASSVVSLARPGSAGTGAADMQRSLSGSSTSTSRSVRPHVYEAGVSTPAPVPKNVDEGDEEDFKSILDPGHPAHQTDESVSEILKTLGLLKAKATPSATDPREGPCS
ncbi:Protein CL16A [Mortierella polycephala]|uniref:Protein CL16A n=1 Tax=Mortierella polycephala TaxID=41804 RepID=A0A9P6U0A7_9FUNG|nr:Protein CL16A [Mortierella polycephala]